MMAGRFLIVAVAAAIGLVAPAAAAEVKLFVGGAMTTPLREIADEFSRATGSTITLVSDTTGGLQRRLRIGEKADVVVVTAQGIEALQAEKLTAPTGRIDLARALIGVAVRRASVAPDISSVAAFTQTLQAARSISYVDPAAGGTSGTYLAGLFKRLGIADEVAAKTVFRGQGADVAAAVAGGEAELGLTFTSELAPNPRVTVVGVLPPEIQSPTIYSAASSAAPINPEGARAFLQALQTPMARAAIAKIGLEALVGTR